MRHKKSGRKFNRTPSHRKALLNNLAIALVKNGRITTTVAKAKTLRGVVEPLVTLALRNDVHARRQAYVVLGDRSLVAHLFDEIGPLFTSTGGYTRVIKLAQPRKGDAAPLAIIEFVKQPAVAYAEGKDAAAQSSKKEAASQASAAKEVVKAAPKKAASESVSKEEA